LITIIKNITIDSNENIDNKINKLQEVNNELSCLIKNYGTYNLFDLLTICFGTIKNDKNDFKVELLEKYFHPISYKIMNKTIQQDNNTFGCFDINNSYKQFYVKVHGLKVNYYNDNLKKGIIIYGIVDDVLLEFLYDNKFISDKLVNIKKNLPNENKFNCDSFDRFVSSLKLKDLLINNNVKDFYDKFIGHLSQNKILKQKTMNQIIKEFIADDLFSKRNTLLCLLINSENYGLIFLVRLYLIFMYTAYMPQAIYE
jgi:hypothetical protein